MNLRILKKLSARAAPYLAKLGDTRQQFKAEKGENYTGLIITARKHWERCPSVHADTTGRRCIVLQPKCRAGTKWPYVKVYDARQPRKGTAMIGGMSGYYEPEWDEQTAWEALETLVGNHFTDVVFDIKKDRHELVSTRNLSSIGAIFAAADEMVANL